MGNLKNHHPYSKRKNYMKIKQQDFNDKFSRKKNRQLILMYLSFYSESGSVESVTVERVFPSSSIGALCVYA